MLTCCYRSSCSVTSAWAQTVILRLVHTVLNDYVRHCQGFHRYSTDEYWHVPHFEKMLYDQGQLAETYADCYALTKDSSLKETLCEILDYVKRDLLHPVRRKQPSVTYFAQSKSTVILLRLVYVSICTIAKECHCLF